MADETKPINEAEKEVHFIDCAVVNENQMLSVDVVETSDKEEKSFYIKGFLPHIYADFIKNYGNGATMEVVHNVPLNKVFEQYMISKTKLNIDTTNIVFVGNSLVEGMRMMSKGENNFICKVGITLEGLKSGYYPKLYNYSCDTVVIGMGTNELGSYSETKFKNSYMDLVNHIRSINPDCNIICMSIPPVSQNKSNSSSSFNNTNVVKYNGYIQSLCQSEGLIYIDNSEFFGTVLNSSWTPDGIHLNGKIYRQWYDFVINKISEL